MAVDPGDALRTFLFVPGDRPDRIAKAYRSGADCVIVDLEDAVAGARKAEVRHSAVAAIGREAQADGPGRTWLAIRVNGAASGLMAQDIAGLALWTKRDFIVLPMADVPSVREVTALMDAVERHGSTSPEGPRIIALFETAESVLNAAGVAAADPRVAALALGPADLAKQLGLTLTADGRESCCWHDRIWSLRRPRRVCGRRSTGPGSTCATRRACGPPPSRRFAWASAPSRSCISARSSQSSRSWLRRRSRSPGPAR
jgi:citrate lyase beta subunit